jgi:hypothetical protein
MVVNLPPLLNQFCGKNKWSNDIGHSIFAYHNKPIPKVNYRYLLLKTGFRFDFKPVVTLSYPFLIPIPEHIDVAPPISVCLRAIQTSKDPCAR